MAAQIDKRQLFTQAWQLARQTVAAFANLRAAFVAALKKGWSMLKSTQYTFEIRPGSPGYVFATDTDGQEYEIYLQYGAVEPHIADQAQRAALLAQARAYRAPAPVSTPRDTSRDILDVRAEMRRAGFDA